MEPSKNTKRSLSCGGVVRSARHGLFGVLFVTSKRIHSSRVMAAFWLLVQLVQMLSFVLSTPALGANWRSSLLPIKVLTEVSSPRKLGIVITPQMLVGLYWTAVAWSVVFIVLLLHGMASFIRNSFSALWALRALRIVGQLTASILFIPIATIVMSPFTCSEDPNSVAAADDFWTQAGYVCSGAPLVTLRVISILLVAALMFMCCTFAVAFFDSQPLSRNPLARAHGRAELTTLIIFVVAVIFVSVFGAFLSPWLLVAILYGCGVVWLGSLLIWMPLYSHAMNRASVASAVIFLFAVVCLTVNLGYPGTDAAVMLYISTPLAALTGVWAADERMWRIVRTPVAQLSNAYEVELKARYMLHSALWGHPVDEHSLPAVATAASGAGSDADAGDDDDTRVETLRKRVPASVIAEVHAMYRAAAGRFRSSAILHVFFARFYSVWLGNRHMQMSHLLQAERRSPPLDVSFLVFQARKLAESSGAGGNVTALNRVTFEKYAADARRCVVKSANKQAQFWAELLDAKPDLTRLHRLSTDMNSAIHEAEHAFTQLFAINPQSLVVLRLYAAFNSLVTCNGDKAGVLSAEADRIEDQRSKEHRHDSSGKLQLLDESALDILADNTAVFTIGGQPRNLGQILSVNSAACKLVGFSRLQLERRSVFTLLPPPLDAFHEAALKQYVGTGEGRIVDYNLVTLAVKAGVAVPVLMCVRETPPEDGNSTFIVLMREVRLDAQVILLNASMHVTAATALSVEALGMEGSVELPIADCVADWATLLPRLQAGDSVVMRLESQRGAGDSGHGRRGSASGLAITLEGSGAGRQPSDDAPGDARAYTWVRASLQRIDGGSGDVEPFFALHWTRIKGNRAASIAPGVVPLPVQAVHADLDASDAGMDVTPPGSAGTAGGSNLKGEPDAGDSSPPAAVSPTRTTTFSPDTKSCTDMLLMATDTTLTLPNAPIGDEQQLATDPARPQPSHSDDSLSAAVGMAGGDSSGALSQRSAAQQPPPRIRGTSHTGFVVQQTRSLTLPQRTEHRTRAGSIGGTDNGHRERDDESRHDGSSIYSKGSSTFKAMGRLRRALSDPDQHLLPGLYNLRIVGIAITLLAIALATTNAVITNAAFSQYSANLMYVNWGSKRMVASFDAIIALQDLVYMARGYTSYDANVEAALRAQIRGNTSAFAGLHRSMYAAVQGTSTQTQYTAAYITLRRFDTAAAAASPYGEQQAVNLYQAGNDFVTFSNLLSYQPLVNLSDPLNPTLQYVYLNDMPLGNAHELLHRSLELGYATSLATSHSVTRNQTIIYSVMMCLLLLIAAAVFLPILCVVESAKDVISLRFLELPIGVRQKVYLQALRRLRTLKRNYVGADEDDDEGGSDGSADDSDRDGEDAQADADILLGEADDEDDATVDWNALLPGDLAGGPRRGRTRTSASAPASRRVAPAPLAGIGGRRSAADVLYRKSPVGFVLLLLRFVGPLIALMAFFSIVFAVSFTTLSSVTTTSAIVTAALERTTCSRESIMDTRRLLEAYGERSYIVTQFSGLSDTTACILYNQQLLAFGTSEDPRGEYALHTVPVETGGTSSLFDSSITSPIYAALFSNACPYIVAATGGDMTLDRCSAFNAGIFTQGLVAAENDMVDRMSRLADRRLRSRTYIAGSAAGTAVGTVSGVVVAANVYNYTQDSCDIMNCLGAGNYDFTGSALPIGPMPDPFFRGDLLPNATASLAPPASLSAYSLAAELQSTDMRTAMEAETKYHGVAVNAIARAYNDAVTASINTVVTFQTAFVVVFIVFFVVFQLLVFLPNVAAVNRDIQAKRAMLLYLPPEIVSRVKAIRSLVDDILRSDAASGAADTASINAMMRAAQQRVITQQRQASVPTSAAGAATGDAATVVTVAEDEGVSPVSPPAAVAVADRFFGAAAPRQNDTTPVVMV